jgi:hypothetical protein
MSGTLPTWMERWFGLASRPGMGTAWRLAILWPLPAWATLLLAAMLLAAVVHVYLREKRQASRAFRLVLAFLRLCLIGLVLAMAAQVALLLQRTGLPYLVLIVDDTRSMNTVDHYDDTLGKSLEDRIARAISPTAQLSRWNVERALFAEDEGAMLSALAEDHKLRLYFLSDFRETRAGDVPGIVAELKSATADGASTRLGAAIRTALDELRGTTPVAVVVASDGINTEGPGLLEAASYARRKGVPLYTIGIGSDGPARGLRLSDLEVEETVFVNDEVHFRFKLTANGFQEQKATVVLTRETTSAGGSAAKEEIVGQVEVTLAADGQPQQVVIPYRPTQPGQFRFKVEIESGTPGSDFSRKETGKTPNDSTSNLPIKGESPNTPPKGGTTSAPPGDKTASEPLTAKVQVCEVKVRVLLVNDSPRYEWRYLYNMLGRDPSIDVHTLLQEADLEFDEEEKKKFIKDFPVSLKDLQTYAVVIFGDVNPLLLSPSALQNLADYVDHGGALIVIAGPNFMPKAYANTPLARLLPFDPATVREPDPSKLLSESIVVQPTELGRGNSAMQLEDSPQQSQARWQKLPALAWMLDVSDLKPAGRVLAENSARTGPDGKHPPLIILQYVGGGGQVLFHATDETYKWRRGVGDLYFARYWVQMLRFLTRSRLAESEHSVRLSTDRREYRQGDTVGIQAAFADDRTAPLDDNGVTIELEQPGRQTERVQLRRDARAGDSAPRDRFEAALQNLPAGSYHAKMVVPSVTGNVPAADFVVRPPESEKIDVPADAADMRQAAALTNGKYYTIEDVSRLPGDLPGGRQVPVENLPPVPLWNRWPVLLLFLVLLIAEWLLRKRGGMV